jgi:DNA polymerase (family 10)
MTRDDVAAALDEIGTLLSLKGEDGFRCNAYHTAAQRLREFNGDLREMVLAHRLTEIPGIGKSLQDKITTLVTTGQLPELNELRAATPPGLLEMLRLPGMGPKKVKMLYDVLGIDSIEKLKAACDRGDVARQKGFGQKTQQKILEGIAFLGQVGNRVRIDLALPFGLALLDRIRSLPGVIRAELCGSLRRRRETAKDIDILASSDDPQPIMDAFVRLPEVVQVVAHGPTKSSVVATMNIAGEKVTLNADLRIVADDQFAFGLLYLTGSKDHNIRLRQRALDQGWTLNEYGLTNRKKSVAARTEEEIYDVLGLDYIPPELREDTGEIEAAAAGTLPVLVSDTEIRGVFHNHTTYSDGTASLEQMALAARDLGFEYIGVGDHSQSLTIGRGMSPATVRKQWAEIDRLNAKLDGITILKGIECDILEDGSLDYDDELLAGFDYVVASVHTLFGMSEEQMTARVCKALAHPAVTMLGHCTGRLLLRREGYKLNIHEVLKTAAQHGKMIEINAQPSRLDLDWLHVKQARDLGIPLVINPDAHNTAELSFYRFGVDVARRGWLSKADVFNTRTLAAVRKHFQKQRKPGKKT